MQRTLHKLFTVLITAATLAGGLLSHASDNDAPPTQFDSTLTIIKLRAAQAAFLPVFPYTSEYVSRYLALDGGDVIYPASEVLKEPGFTDLLYNIRIHKFIPRATKQIQAGKWTPGHTYPLHYETSMARPKPVSDFKYAIGGCVVETDVLMEVEQVFVPGAPFGPGETPSPHPTPGHEGPTPSPGAYITTVSFASWKSSLKDVYKWDYNDKIGVELCSAAACPGIVFEEGEVHQLEVLGLAKPFNVTSEIVDMTNDLLVATPFNVTP